VTNPALGVSKWLMVKGELEGEISDTFTFFEADAAGFNGGFSD